MFLNPHHFQQWDRYYESLLNFRLKSTSPLYWGLVEIDINREVFDFSSEVTGVISGNKNGNTMLLAYAGEIDSLDFAALDFNSVVGFTTISKISSEADYSLPIFPYGFNIPIEDVYILALIDNNGNSIPDAGDAIGFHTDLQTLLPQPVTINQGSLSDINIDIP